MAETYQPGRRRQRGLPELVSIVVPVFNEKVNLAPLCGAIHEAMGEIPYEVILVEDGSTDGTFEEIERLAGEDARICGVSLSRNVGHQYSLAAGLDQARGQVVIMMDGDLQHPPELLPELIEKWREGYNVVQTRRRDAEQVGWVKRTCSRLFYRVFSLLCGIRLEPGTADFRLLDRMVLDELKGMREGHLFLRGLITWMGYRRAVVPFDPAPRRAGTPKYTFRKMLRFAKSGMFSFSSVPLRVGVWVGVAMAILSFAELLFVLGAYLSGKAEGVPGWASTIVVMTFLFGVLFLLVGLQGEYLIRIYERVQRRPSFMIERIVRQRTDDDETPREGEAAPTGRASIGISHEDRGPIVRT